MNIKEKLAVFSIFIIAFILRFYNLDKNPPGLYWDEVSIGYNAYSLSQTGRDEYGKTWPVLFRAFNEYKLPGYIYTLVPLVKFFGLNDFIVRLPAAFFGFLAVVIFYFLTKEIGKDIFENRKFVSYFSLVSSFLLAVSPWHLQFSRFAIEAQPAFTFFLLGLLFLFKGTKKSFSIYFPCLFLLYPFIFITTSDWLPALSFLFIFSFIERGFYPLKRKWRER